MDIVPQFFACFSQKIAPAEKIAPTGRHGRHVFATLCPGWSDTEGASDQHTFKDLLRHLQKERLTCIKVFSGFVCVSVLYRDDS